MKRFGAKWVAGALALVMTAGLAVTASAEAGRRHRGGRFGEPMFGFFGRQLNLTDAQHDQMKQIMAKERPAMQPLMKQLADSNRQLRQLEMSGTFDENQVRALASQQAQTMTELTVQRARVHSELYNVLTADQKSTLNQLIQERREKFQQRHQGPASAPAPAPQGQ